MIAHNTSKLTIQDIDAHDSFKHLSDDEKEALISFVYDLATILYYTSGNDDEQS